MHVLIFNRYYYSMKRFVLFILCLSYISCMKAQLSPVKRNTNIAFGINKRASDSTLVSKMDIGLLSNTDSLCGIQLGAFTSVIRRDVTGVNIGGLFTLTGNDATGVQICGAVNSVVGEIRGAQLSFISNIAHSMKGLQIAGFTNISTTPFRGIQFSVVTNISMGVKRGLQFCSIANICSSYMRGLQIGAYNYADTVNGSQLGLLNVCISHPRGVQIGLFNYSRDTLSHKIGLVNVNPKTRIDIMYYIGTSSKLNFAMRFRNRSTYSIVGVGTHYMGLDKHFSGALFYRLGQYFNITKKWSISSDIGYYHVETFNENEDKPQRLYSLQLHINADYQINRYLGAYGSIGYGDTRYYEHAHEYRNRAIVEIGLSYRYHHVKNK